MGHAQTPVYWSGTASWADRHPSRARGGEGSLLVVEGQAGVGKTELLRASGELGEAEGLRVLRTRGSDLDGAFAFGVVRQLLEREVADDPQRLTGGAEPAAAVFAAVGGDTRAEEGLFSSLQGLHWLVVNLAARGPLLLLADDVHWADTASLRWLVFLAERVEDVRALIVAATRPAEPGADQELLDALMMAPAARVLRPAPLSAGATATVVRTRLPGAVDAFSAACHQATGGNPFLLGELLDELAADGVQGSADDAGKVLEFGPERLGRAVRRRLRGLPAEATSVARAVAVLGPRAPLDEVAGLAELDEVAAGHAADALVGIHVLAASRALDFVHLVVRSAVYEQIPPLSARRCTSRPPVSSRPAVRRASAWHGTCCACRRPPTLRARRRCVRPPAARRRAATPGQLRITCGARSRSRRAKRIGALCCTSSAWPRQPTASETPSTAICARRWPRRAIRSSARRSRSRWAAPVHRSGTSGRRQWYSMTRCAAWTIPMASWASRSRPSCSRCPFTSSRRPGSARRTGIAGSVSWRPASSSIPRRWLA